MLTALTTLTTATIIASTVGGIVIYETIRYPIAYLIGVIRKNDGMH